MGSKVQVFPGPPFFQKLWAFSSAGRAPDLHSGGQRFDPAKVHHFPLLSLSLKFSDETLLEAFHFWPSKSEVPEHRE